MPLGETSDGVVELDPLTPGVPPECKGSGFRNCMGCVAGVWDVWVSVLRSLVLRRSTVRFRQAAQRKTGSDQRKRSQALLYANPLVCPWRPPRGTPGGTRGFRQGSSLPCTHCMGRHAMSVVHPLPVSLRGEMVGACVGGVCRLYPVNGAQLRRGRRPRTASIAVTRAGYRPSSQAASTTTGRVEESGRAARPMGRCPPARRSEYAGGGALSTRAVSGTSW